MLKIRAGDEVATVINVFAVDPTNQRALIELILTATDEVMAALPGFVAAGHAHAAPTSAHLLHCGLAGTDHEHNRYRVTRPSGNNHRDQDEPSG